ncbi:MAG: sugar-transfer associated ATP-grasp domain-containing protein [Oscillospiraceae bacterium]
MTMNHNVSLARMVNDATYYPLLNDKFQFLQRYEAFLGRRWLDLREADPQTLARFCQDCGVVFAKPHAEFGGKGVERLEPGPDTDFVALHRRLMDGGQFLVEEAIRQHPEVARLCPQSVNTLRVVTLLAEGEAKFVYALLRIGSGQGHVDNISSGGMYTLVGAQGELEFPAFCDQTGLYYDCHPMTGVTYRGYRLPFFQEAVDLCCRAALVEPRLGYIGWDVAITPDGPVLVEGNNLPGYEHGPKRPVPPPMAGACTSHLRGAFGPAPFPGIMSLCMLFFEGGARGEKAAFRNESLRRDAAGQPVSGGYPVSVQRPWL